MAKKEKIFEELDRTAPLVPAALYWKDRNGIYVGVNRFALEASGLKTFSHFIGKTDHDLWPRFAENIFENDKRIMKKCQIAEEEGHITLPNGGIRSYRAIKMPLYDQNNNIVGIIGNHIDTTVNGGAKARKNGEELKF